MTMRLLERTGPRRGDATEVDPRIAARRDSVRSERNRRRLRILGVLGVLAALLAGAWALSRTALFDVDRITVVGAGRLGIDEVVAAAGVAPGEPLLGVDTGAISRRLRSEPWIASARVSRTWQGDVTIAIVERVPVGTVLDADGQPQLVDVSGTILGPSAAEGLPRISGVSEGSLTLASLLPPGVRSRVETVESDDTGALRLRLRPQGTVEFGPASALVEKVAALTTVMGQVDQRDLCTIRVITPDTPVVTRTPICG